MHRKAINILIVDDDPCDCRMAKLVLKRSSQTTVFTIETAQSLADGLACLKTHNFDLLLLDLGLPDSSGIETVQEAHSANPNVPIVVLTGLADEQMGLEAIRQGAEDYLIKGESLEHTLVRTIRYAIERRETRRLKEQTELKSRFISTVSHELRTPLTCMKESAGILLDGAAGKINNEQRRFLDIIKRNIDRLARLINDVLDFQKLEAGKMEVNRNEHDINEVVKEIQQTMAPLAREKKLDFIVSMDETLGPLDFDRDKIIQVLTNLVDNAVKFTTKGSITIATAKHNGSVRVSVEDTGSGIKREDLPRLFREFEQLSDSNERITGGTGLGLAISRKIIEEHSGQIWAESKFGKGTTFYFTMPIRKKEINYGESNSIEDDKVRYS